MTILNGVIKEGKELVVFLLCDRIEFMVVTLRAADREPKKNGAEGVNTIHHRLDAELLGIDAAFLVDLGIAVKASGDFLIESGVREKVASQLLNREFVEREIAIHRFYDPIAVLPNLARRIDAVSIRVGIARSIQPPAAPALAVMRRVEQSLDLPFVSVRARVAQKSFQ